VKIIRTVMSSLAAVFLVGAVASATPAVWNALHAPPTAYGSPAPTESPSPDDSETPEPPESPDLSSPEAESGSVDFSTCDGKTGLDNAICRQEVLLAIHPENPGLANSTERLQLVQATQAAKRAEKTTSEGTDSTTSDGTDSTTSGTTGTDTSSESDAGGGHGHSGEHGNGGANGGANGKGKS